MVGIEIKDVDTTNVDDLINLCIPPERRKERVFIEGAKVKRRWARQVINRYGRLAKLAYRDGRPVGMIQFLPEVEKNRMVNQFEESEEVEKRGKVFPVIANQRPIKSFFLDRENFHKEVREALKR